MTFSDTSNKKIETTTTVGFDEPILSPMATVDHIHNFAGGCSHDHLQFLMKCIGSRTISLLLVSTSAVTSRSMLSIGVRSSFRDCCTPKNSHFSADFANQILSGSENQRFQSPLAEISIAIQLSHFSWCSNLTHNPHSNMKYGG